MELTTVTKLKATHQEAYLKAVMQEIGSTIQCLAYKEDKPYAMITFDIFNRSRKWSDIDIELLGMLGCCIVRLLSKEGK